jgi:hypothetical protein
MMERMVPVAGDMHIVAGVTTSESSGSVTTAREEAKTTIGTLPEASDALMLSV